MIFVGWVVFFLSFYFLAGIRNSRSKLYLGGFLFVSCLFLVWSVGFGHGRFGFGLYFNDENKIKVAVLYTHVHHLLLLLLFTLRICSVGCDGAWMMREERNEAV